MNDIEERIRERRRWSLSQIENAALLPTRLTVDEFKNYGIVNVLHTTNKKTEPWLRAGLYKLLNNGRLYLIAIPKTPVKGSKITALVMRPIVRIAYGRDRSQPTTRHDGHSRGGRV